MPLVAVPILQAKIGGRIRNALKRRRGQPIVEPPVETMVAPAPAVSGLQGPH